MRIKILLMAVVLAVLLFSSSASAILTQPSCGVIPVRPLNYQTFTELDKFDSTLGELKAVYLSGEACGNISREISSEDESTEYIDFRILCIGQVIPKFEGIGEKIFQIDLDEVCHLAPDDDGFPDWAGDDYCKEYTEDCTEVQEYTITDPLLMEPYIGFAGQKVTVPVRTFSSNTVEGSNEYYSRGQTNMGITVCVQYEYEPRLCINGSKINYNTGAGIEGWKIILKNSTGSVIDQKLTDANGDYSFCQLSPGDYVVCEENRDGWKHLDAPCRDVTLVDEDVDNVDFYNVPLLCINGSKINDCTGAGIEGWLITLKDSTGATIAQKQTNANGDYSFCGLEPGDYTVCEEDRAGWVHLDEPCREVILEDANVDGVDFNNAPTFCISGHKYNSKTGAGIEGWKITLLDANGNEIANKLTGPGGYYEFCGLAPGNYVVSEETRSGWTPTTPTSIPVTLDCANSENNDFRNQPSANLVCVCPFFLKNELYSASCKEVKVVDASKGILANDQAGSVVLNPESITIDPKYGTIEVHEDGSFVYNPTVATGKLYTGLYVTFRYTANNGLCDSQYPGIAKIQLRC